MKNSLQRWTNQLIQSSRTGMLVLVLTLIVVGTTEPQGTTTPPKGDDPAPQVNWNASGG